MGRRNDSGRGSTIDRSLLHRWNNRLVLIPACESDQSVVVVCLRIGVESKIRVQLDDGISVPLDLSVHRPASRNRDGELADTRGDVKGLGRRRAGGQRDLGWGNSHNDSVNNIFHELIALGSSKRVGRSGGIPRVRPCPQVNLVLVDLGEGSGLEGVGVVGGHV